ncbi:Protein of unknown function [Bacillus mycoides]|uniref:Uncharacterized protein n=1 Tax=Bacillus mycoides TaxID=1405 RepID=A0A1G4LCF5_BACMY|nr:Protein of unknown function [Bacillus mycoides]
MNSAVPPNIATVSAYGKPTPSARIQEKLNHLFPKEFREQVV